jgi:CHAT domain
MKKAPRSPPFSGLLAPRWDRVKRLMRSRENAEPQLLEGGWILDHTRRILYFGANPQGTPALDLYDEVGAIKAELRAARYRCFRVESCFATKADDLIREMRDATPDIVQVGGHGCKAGKPRCAEGGGPLRDAVGVDLEADPACARGLVLDGRDGRVHVVSFELIRQMFELAGSSVKLVVFTACESEPLATLLLAHVPCAIGVSGQITDRASVEFSRGFYAALGDGDSIAKAFKAGRLAVACAKESGADRIKLLVRDDADASEIVLATFPPEIENDEGPIKPRPRKPRKLPGTRRGGKAGGRVASASVLRGKRTRGHRRRRSR